MTEYKEVSDSAEQYLFNSYQNNKLTVRRYSPLAKKWREATFEVSSEQFTNWCYGKLNCFMHLSADDREFIISGYTPDDWKKIFG